MIARRTLTHGFELSAWCLSIALAAFAAKTWHRVTREMQTTVAEVVLPKVVRTERISDSTSAHSERIVASDPFRLVRRPSPIAYRPELEGIAVAPPAPPKPPLMLAGTLGGPPWQAILEGVPGRDGALVVKTGDRVGDLTIRAVHRDTVVVAGLDTVWKLTVRRTWK